METFIKISQLLVSLSLLVLIHEFGHFLFARIFKCRVEKFYLFFNPWFTIWKKKIGETEYGLGWLPLGGYCKISGMVDESMDTEQLAQPAKPWEFRAKPAWQRLLIIVGGVLMNFLLAMMIYIGMTYVWGESYIKTADVVDGFSYSQTAKKIGFQDGDKIISVDGKEVEAYHQIPLEIILGNERKVVIERDGQKQTIQIAEESIKNLLNDAGFLMLRMPFRVGDIEPGSFAERSGLAIGDIVVAADSIEMKYLDQVQEYFTQNAKEEVMLTVMRDGKRIDLPVRVSRDGTIGVKIAGNIAEQYKISTKEYSLLASIPKGIETGFEQVSSYLKQLKLIFSPKTEAYKSVGGFITMGKIFPGEWNWFSFWNITALLSIMLGVINILPIPALDGGHMVFILYEIVTRRKPSQRAMEMAQLLGFFLIIALVLYANGNDILRLFS